MPNGFLKRNMKFELSYKLENEIQFAKNVIAKLDWFLENGYRPRVPKGIDKNSSIEELESVVRGDFIVSEKIFMTIEKELTELLDRHEVAINKFFANFEYDVPENIKVYFTSYGNGGSYYVPNGMSILITNSILDILRIIIHETIHLIIEKPFIRENKIPHFQKEMVVDILCRSSLLADVIKDSKIQKVSEKIPRELIEKLRFKNRESLDYKPYIIEE